MATATKSRRARVERVIYRQANGRLAVCARHARRLHFRTCGGDIEVARRAREELIAALAAGRVPASPRLRLDTVAARWSARFEAMAAAGERHRRTYEAHRFDHDLLPRLGHRRIGSLGVDDVADLIVDLRAAGRSPKTTANALATLQSVLRFAGRREAPADGPWGVRRRHGCWIAALPAAASWSRPPSTPACGSPSSSAWSGPTRLRSRTAPGQGAALPRPPRGTGAKSSS